jgi:hypothetical protein
MIHVSLARHGTGVTVSLAEHRRALARAAWAAV